MEQYLIIFDIHQTKSFKQIVFRYDIQILLSILNVMHVSSHCGFFLVARVLSVTAETMLQAQITCL